MSEIQKQLQELKVKTEASLTYINDELSTIEKLKLKIPEFLRKLDEDASDGYALQSHDICMSDDTQKDFYAIYQSEQRKFTNDYFLGKIRKQYPKAEFHYCDNEYYDESNTLFSPFGKMTEMPKNCKQLF